MIEPNVTLRLASPSDARQIARLSRDLIEDGLAWSWRAERVAARIRSGRANVVVARSGAAVAGFGIMGYGDDEAHLDLFGVVPDFRRVGLGRRLLEWLEAPAIEGGIAAVNLEVRAGNWGAQAFYARLGYHEVGCVEGYYQGRETAVRMRKELGRKE